MTTRPAEYDKLNIAGIVAESNTTIPQPLQQLIATLFDIPRPILSFNAAYVVEKAYAARQGGEELSKQLLTKGIGLECFRDGGHRFATSHPNAHLDNCFLPNKTGVSQEKRLKQAQPDVAVGYLSQREAGLEAELPFTRAEEDLILLQQVRNPRTGEPCPLHVTPQMYFPYYTVQWKHHEAMFRAIVQGARDGAVINEQLRSLFSAAQHSSDPTEPSMVLTVHFSSTFDGRLLLTWVHYYSPDTNKYHMESVEAFVVDQLGPMERYTQFLLNWQDYAMESRLPAIKKALQDLDGNSTPQAEPIAGEQQTAAPVTAPAAKRGRGRPRKNLQAPTEQV
jgi:hypothetical protein